MSLLKRLKMVIAGALVVSGTCFISMPVLAAPCINGGTYNGGTGKCDIPIGNVIYYSNKTGPVNPSVTKSTYRGGWVVDTVVAKYILNTTTQLPMLNDYCTYANGSNYGCRRPKWEGAAPYVQTINKVNNDNKSMVSDFWFCYSDAGIYTINYWDVMCADTPSDALCTGSGGLAASSTVITSQGQMGGLGWYDTVTDYSNYYQMGNNIITDPTACEGPCYSTDLYTCIPGGNGGRGVHPITVYASELTGCPTGYIEGSNTITPAACTQIQSTYGSQANVGLGSCAASQTFACYATGTGLNTCPAGSTRSGTICSANPSGCQYVNYPGGWANVSAAFTSGSIIAAADVNALRTDINLRRADAGLAACSYSDTISTGTVIKASQYNEMRQCILDVYTACNKSLPANGTVSVGNKIGMSEWTTLKTNIFSAP